MRHLRVQYCLESHECGLKQGFILDKLFIFIVYLTIR